MDGTIPGQVELTVNDTPVKLKYFTHGFIEHIINGILGSLRGTGEIENLELSIDEERQVKLNLNGAVITLTPFANKIICGTITGMVSTLKGAGKLNRLNLIIKQ